MTDYNRKPSIDEFHITINIRAAGPAWINGHAHLFAVVPAETLVTPFATALVSDEELVFDKVFEAERLMQKTYEERQAEDPEKYGDLDPITQEFVVKLEIRCGGDSYVYGYSTTEFRADSAPIIAQLIRSIVSNPAIIENQLLESKTNLYNHWDERREEHLAKAAEEDGDE